jgi:hypothetical protein
VLVIVVASTAGALAFRGAQGGAVEDQEAGEGSGGNTDRIVERLADAGITTNAAEFEALADDHGAGGAVRILAFADAAGVDQSEIIAMRDDGMGWGEIAHALADANPDFELGPGIGWIMGHGNGNGHGQGQGNGQGHGQNKDKPGGGDDTDD